MYLLLVFLPLLGSLVAGFGGRLVGGRGAALVTTSCVGAALLLSVLVFYEVALAGSPCSLVVAPWMASELLDARWGLYFDSLTAVMLVVVTAISVLVHLYSLGYMGADPHLPRFMAYLSVFTLCMLLLVTADNLVQMFFGWEGVGLASYLLINFWYTRLPASQASIKAMLVNRVGDFGFALGIMAVFATLGTVDLATLWSCAPHLVGERLVLGPLEVDTLTLIGVLLFVGAVGKSAQLGLHTWLPDAMEGPTPVSALIHAATMVTAGVFLLARCSPLYEYAPGALVVVAGVGAATCVFAATTGVVQNDLKRVIAYSTASQLGYMVFACGLSHYGVGIFHLMTHACFKALLFLGAGSVIHALGDEQDMRRMGGLARLLPYTYAMMTIGSLALVGFPYLAGFYSKEVILEVAYSTYTATGHLAYGLGSLVVVLTSYYSFRLLFLAFLTPSTAPRRALVGVHEAPASMAIPLALLALGSILVGYLGREMMLGVGTDFWGAAIHVRPEHSVLLEAEWLPPAQKLLPLLGTLLGAGVAALVAWPGTLHRGAYGLTQTAPGRDLYTFLNQRWYVDRVYNRYLAGTALALGYGVTWKTLDKGVFEVVGPAGIATTLSRLLARLRALHSGLIYHYAVVLLLGLVGYITLAHFWDTLAGLVDPRVSLLLAVALAWTSPLP
jgi:proton-translocating NADH-quinone oxidoreductase chain L